MTTVNPSAYTEQDISEMRDLIGLMAHEISKGRVAIIDPRNSTTYLGWMAEFVAIDDQLTKEGKP